MNTEEKQAIKMEVKEVIDKSKKLYEAIEEVMMQEETPDIVYISVLSRHLCECLVATGASRVDAMEKLNAIYEIIEHQEEELMQSLGSSTSIN
jgi:hypothetical protein